MEDNWEQEKKIRAEVEKARRKAEGDLKITIENLNEMERAKIDLEEVIKKYVEHHLHVPLKLHESSDSWKGLVTQSFLNLLGGTLR